MALVRFQSGNDPFGDLMRLQQELDQFFGSAFGASLAPSGRGVFPAINIFDHGAEVVVKTELPGVRLEDLNLVIENDTLSLSGKRTIKFDTERPRFHRREREEGEFGRLVRLPTKLDTTAAQASYKNGVLTITIPKAKEAQPRQITIQAT